MGAKREDQLGDVGASKRIATPTLRFSPRLVSSASLRGSEDEGRGDDEADGGERQLRGDALAADAVEVLLLSAQPAEEDRQAEHEEDVADDRAGDGGLDDFVQPGLRAKKAMIISTALPKVALSRPPMPEPTRRASSSVAVPRILARGTMASEAEMKSQSLSAWMKPNTNVMGTKTSSE